MRRRAGAGGDLELNMGRRAGAGGDLRGGGAHHTVRGYGPRGAAQRQARPAGLWRHATGPPGFKV